MNPGHCITNFAPGSTATHGAVWTFTHESDARAAADMVRSESAKGTRVRVVPRQVNVFGATIILWLVVIGHAPR